MRWEDERYVRVYVRDTVTWLMLSFKAKSLLVLLLRKADRAGLIHLGPYGKKAVGVVIGHPHEEGLEEAVGELEAAGVVIVSGADLVFPKYIEAQETPQSDKQRSRESRAKARDIAKAGESITPRNAPSQDDTPRHALSRNVSPPTRNVSQESRNVSPPSRDVTPRNAASHDVTPCRAVPSRAVPSRAVPSRAEETPSESGGADAQPPAAQGTLVEEYSTTKGPTPHAYAFAAWTQDERVRLLGPTTARERGLKRHQWARLGELLRDHGRKLADAAWLLWAADAYALEKGLPLGLFAHQWPDWVTRAQRGPPPPGASVGRAPGGGEACARPGCGGTSRGGLVWGLTLCAPCTEELLRAMGTTPSEARAREWARRQSAQEAGHA